jgi:HPt (histidine-containing phosphotransfer) domain-containing protein
MTDPTENSGMDDDLALAGELALRVLSPEDEAAARAAGMSDFATKPITRARLQQIVASACPASDAPAPATAPVRDAIDRSTLDRFVDELGVDVAREIIAVFLRDTQARLAVMPDLLGDRPRLSREAHSLKSAAATLGLSGLAKRAARIERGGDVLHHRQLLVLHRDRLDRAGCCTCREALHAGS